MQIFQGPHQVVLTRKGALMLTVDHDEVSVESDLFAGVLKCPGCGGRLRPWSFARSRRIRHGLGFEMVLVVHRPRRGRCAVCAATHVLLPVVLAARRADEAAVIARAVALKAVAGTGHRKLADWLGRPVSTVRGWLRAVAVSAAAMTAVFTGLLLRDAPDAASVWPAPVAAGISAALVVVEAYAQVFAGRWAVDMVAWHVVGLSAVGPWFFSAPWWLKATNTS